MSPPIRVLLADDEDLIRAALAALLELEPDVTVVAQAADGRAAVDTALAHRPDVAVVDLEMPALDGFGVTTELVRLLPGCAVVILTGHGRPAHLPRERETLRLAEYGAPVAVVARRAHLSSGTVRNYLASAVQKLGADSRAEAVRIARDDGWL